MDTVIMIKITTIKELKDFVTLCCQHKGDVLVKKGSFTVSGKSIMGMISIDLDEPFIAEFLGDITPEIEAELNRFRPKK